MRTPDVNVLLYAVNADCQQQRVAVEWLEQAFATPGGIGFSWASLLGFIRTATRAGIFARPLALDEALGIVDDWLGHPHARLLIGAGRAGDLVSDAHLAATAIEHGVILGCFDHDFERFPGLQFEHLPQRDG